MNFEESLDQLFKQFQMLKPWRENAEALIYIGRAPDSVCCGIECWQHVGVDTLLLMLGAGNTTHEQVMRSLDILGAKVIPTFKEAAI